MKADKTTKIYKKVFDITENHFEVNRTVKAVIINFGDDRGDVIVKNDNFGTRRKYADFTNGKIYGDVNDEFTVLLKYVKEGENENVEVMTRADQRLRCYGANKPKTKASEFLAEARACAEINENRLYRECVNPND